MSTIGETIGVIPKSMKVPWKYDGVNLFPVDSDEIIGIEVEVENTQFTGDVRRPWNIKEDGSLRNDGREVVSDPIVAREAPMALYHLLVKGLSDACSFNMRTSIHIHLNATDMNEAQVRDLVALYTIFEPALFNFAGRGRWKSVFCVPLNECNEIPRSIGTLLAQGRWEKYTALNLRRLADLGTIEFRHLGGTFDVDRISQWIGIICHLKHYVMQTGSKLIRTEIAELHEYSDFNGIAQRVFGEYSRLLQVSDSNVYYSASLNARPIFSSRQDILAVEEDSPMYTFMRSSKRGS